MSKFLTDRYQSLDPYTPGEQPKEREYIKLNTNESPFPPSPTAIKLASEELRKLMLYSDPECKSIVSKMAEVYGIKSEKIIMTNGSDEVLNFAFMAYCDENTPAVFADITYGFYKVFAQLNGIPTKIIPLREDFSIDIEDYINTRGTVFIANPNAPTGILLPREDIERLLKSDPARMVIIDEAYIDFGGKSCIDLTEKYPNLLVTGTFSKSRSMAGARLGFGIASPEIINDLTRIRYSTNPYNVNRMTMAAGVGALSDPDYFEENCKKIIENREWTKNELKRLGFVFTDSKANFVFVRHPDVDGEKLYLALKEKGVLVRHFSSARISDYNRITVGNHSEMQILIDNIKEIIDN